TVYDTVFKEGCSIFLLSAMRVAFYIKESEEIRLAMLPLELIKRGFASLLRGCEFERRNVREIEQDVYTESETAQKKDSKQTAAVDLSKRLKDTCSLNDAASLK
ncbi:hypothetical protein S245_029645, partial [Arachis hypogaea]